MVSKLYLLWAVVFYALAVSELVVGGTLFVIAGCINLFTGSIWLVVFVRKNKYV